MGSNVIILLLNRGNRSKILNYRLICLSLVYKLYTSIVKNRMVSIVGNTLEDEQGSFGLGRPKEINL